MDSCSGFQLFLCFVLGLLPRFGLAQRSEPLDFVEGRYFEVVGTDNRSVSFVNTLGEHVAEICTGYLETGSHEFPQCIFVALRPEERFELDGDYQITIGARGQVSLDFRWAPALKLETVCRALTEAYIVHYANFNYGPDASERIRYWAMSALGSQSYLSLRAAQQGQYIQAARAHCLRGRAIGCCMPCVSTACSDLRLVNYLIEQSQVAMCLLHLKWRFKRPLPIKNQALWMHGGSAR